MYCREYSDLSKKKRQSFNFLKTATSYLLVCLVVEREESYVNFVGHISKITH